MPEGDTIHRAARTLDKAIAGRVVTAASSPRPDLAGVGELPGRAIVRVEARGKHLLVRFDDGSSLHTHMGMEGSWHVYRPGERWWHGEHRAVVVLETEAWVAVCFDAPLAELCGPGVEPLLVRNLGPDLLVPEVDLDEAVARLSAIGDRPIGEAIMRQDRVAGIGNVLKSEVLFLTRVSPFTPVGELDSATLARVLREARRWMVRSVRSGRRITRQRAGSRVWVYDRSGEPCFECGATIRMRRQGASARSTYFCPTCQAVDGVSR